MKKNKLEVGQKVWIKGIGNQQRFAIKETTIKEVGRKYFKVDPQYGRFSKETLVQDGGNWISNYKIYLTLQDYLDEKEYNFITSRLRSFFGSYFMKSFTLEELRKIIEIVSVKYPEYFKDEN